MAKTPRSERGSVAAGGPRARLFVALDLPEEARRALGAWRDELLAGRPDLRPARQEQLHVTLAFLGWQRESDIEAIAAAAFEAARGFAPPRLTAACVRGLPPRAPRLFALDLADQNGRAGALQGAIAGSLAQGGHFRPERRPFWPHITLARVKRGAKVPSLPGLAPPPEPINAAELTLYRSTLRPQGALYEPLARRRLAGGENAVRGPS